MIKAKHIFGILLLVFPLLLFAQSDQVIITQTVTGPPDTTPPSAPSNLVATSVAPTQINLTWTAATDDVAIGGYQVLRDAVQIATATLTSYSDTGLTASTTYAYEVFAFDTSFNISTSSATTSETTLPTPPAPPAPSTSTPSGGSSQLLEQPSTDLISIEVVPSFFSAVIRWKTTTYTKSVLKWGQTGSYELGFIAEEIFAREHETTITGLIPGRTYEFVIDAENFINEDYVLVRSRFNTLSLPDIVAPVNVRNLTAGIDGDDVVLSWVNPTETDFSHVRVLKSTTFYPGDPLDGAILFEGSESLVRDNGAALNGDVIYYTVFAYDKSGNVSSGAIVAVRLKKGGPLPSDGLESVEEILPATSTIEEHEGFSFNDIIFRHGARALIAKNGSVTVDAKKSLTIAVPYEAVPEHLKTITVTLADPEFPTRTFSFLLRINSGKTEYEAIIAPLLRNGTFPLELSVFDLKLKSIDTVYGLVVSETIEIGGDERGVGTSFIGFLIEKAAENLVWFILLLITLLISAYGLVRYSSS